MKNLLIISLVALATYVIAAPESVSVGVTSVVVLPQRQKRDYSPWIGNTNSYAVGQYLSYKSKNYIVTTAGTATNLPPIHNAGTATRDGVGYRYIMPGVRKGAAIVNDSANVVYLAEDGRTAVANTGIRLNANGGAYVLSEGDQQEVQAISVGSTNNIAISDR